MSRKIVILGAGSRGDIQPCVALGRGLLERGDKVRIVGVNSPVYEALTASAGLEYFGLTASPTEIMESDEAKAWLAGGRNPVKFVGNFRRLIKPMAQRLLDEVFTACADA